MEDNPDRPTRVCVAGATGWTGRAVAEAVRDCDDMVLTSGVARRSAGQDLGEAWGGPANGVAVRGSINEAMDEVVDVLVDYTSHEAVRANVLTAIEAGVHVVVGSSGLSSADYGVIDREARSSGVGVVAGGNFSVTAAMAQAAALLVAPFLPSREILDYASATKPDAPSGTSRELAERLAGVNPTDDFGVAQTSGQREARGATVAGTQVHSLRLHSFSVSTEVVFTLPDERLTIRHDAGSSAAPYVAGTLLAVRAAPERVGLIRGLDTLLLDRMP